MGSAPISNRAPSLCRAVAACKRKILTKANREFGVRGTPSLRRMPNTRVGEVKDLSRGCPSADEVLASLRFWEQRGGYREYGRHAEASCFPMINAPAGEPNRSLWPLGLYPATGAAEVVFQYLKG